MNFRIEYTGILGDKWMSGKIYTDRKAARAEVRWIMTDGSRFEIGQRARVHSARVVEWK